MTSNKDAIKKAVIAEVRKLESICSEASDEEVHNIIFRNSNSIRLKKSGWNILRRNFECEQFELSKKLTGKELIVLQNKLEWPYFLSAKNIYLFSTKDIFTLRLMGGDVSKWLS